MGESGGARAFITGYLLYRMKKKVNLSSQFCSMLFFEYENQEGSKVNTTSSELEFHLYFALSH